MLGATLPLQTGPSTREMEKMSFEPRFSQLYFDRLGWSVLVSGEGPFDPGFFGFRAASGKASIIVHLQTSEDCKHQFIANGTLP